MLVSLLKELNLYIYLFFYSLRLNQEASRLKFSNQTLWGWYLNLVDSGYMDNYV